MNKKFGVHLDGTLKLGKKLNSYFVDFDGVNTIFIGNPKSFYVSYPTKGFEYFDRVLVRLPYVVKFFTDKEEVFKKSLKTFEDTCEIVLKYGIKGIILTFGNVDDIYKVQEIYTLLSDIGSGVNLYLENAVKGVVGDISFIKDLSDDKVVINLANAWGMGYDFDDDFINTIKNDIVIMNGNKKGQGSHKVSVCAIDDVVNKYYDVYKKLIRGIEGDKIFVKKSVEDLYVLGR